MPEPPEISAVASAAAAVDRILACADEAVEAIAASTQIEVRRIEAEAEAAVKPQQEAVRRKAQLAVLRIELARQSAKLASAYAESVEELGRVEQALISLGGDPDETRPLVGEEPGDAGIRMTLRERTTIEAPPWAAGDDSSGSEPAPTFSVEAVAPVTEPAMAPVPAALDERPARRRSWRLWQRDAA
jgi:hypothetical protein